MPPKMLQYQPISKEARELASNPTYQEMAKTRARKFRTRCSHIPLEELEAEALFVLVLCSRGYSKEKGPFANYLQRSLTRQLWRFVSTWSNYSFHTWKFSDLNSKVLDLDYLLVDEPPRAYRETTADRLAPLKRVLPPRWWQVLYLRYACGLLYREVGVCLGVHKNRVRQIEDSARARLARYFPGVILDAV